MRLADKERSTHLDAMDPQAQFAPLTRDAEPSHVTFRPPT